MRRVRKIYFEKAADVPNSTLPVLLYRSVLALHTAGKASAFRQRFESAAWTGIWTDTIYDYTHFHSNAHEVLGIAEGKVTLRLGGDVGRLLRLKAGDMLVLPAGVGHRRVGGDDGLKVIGAYPRGQSHYDMKRRGRAIPRVRLPSNDPFYGTDGPLVNKQAKRLNQEAHYPLPEHVLLSAAPIGSVSYKRDRLVLDPRQIDCK